MNKIITILLLAFALNCTAQNVRVLSPTDTTANLKVKVVRDRMAADMWVVIVQNRQDAKYENCYWNFVKRRENFTVRFVDKDEDFKVFFSDSVGIVISEFVHTIFLELNQNNKIK